jgi:hypothetical protein
VFKDCVKTGQRVGEELTSERQRLVQYDEQAFVKGKLMLMSVFVGLAEIFFRLFIKSLLAAKRAEVIGLSIVFRCPAAVAGSMSIPQTGSCTVVVICCLLHV